jgi:hypothetical protein
VSRYVPNSLTASRAPRRDPVPVAAPTRQFATFNANGTVAGSGQSSRPGARLAPVATAPSSSPRPQARLENRPLASASAVANIPSPGNLLSSVSGASSRLRNLGSTIAGGVGGALGGAAGSALNNILGVAGTGVLDPNIELFLQTVEQLGALGDVNPGEFGPLNVSPPDAIRSQGNNRATVSARDFTSNNGNRQPNVLRDYNHYNYSITLGILNKDEFNNPLSYRQGGFRKIILQSGGGGLEKRQRVAAEEDSHAEYFIENLNIDAVIAPNPNTGVGLGTTIEFEVTEPYSMGKFTESLIDAAVSEGFTNFTNAPFCLRIDFKGWGDNSENLTVTKPYYIPIMFINVEFSVTNSGSRYQVKAIAANNIANSNSVDSLKNDLSVSGTKVHEILQNSVQSVTNVINKRPEENDDDSKPFIPEYDRYIVAFPTSETGIVDAINNGFSLPENATIERELAIRLGVESRSPDNVEGAVRVLQSRRLTADDGVFNVLSAYAAVDINKIGESLVNENSAEGSNQDMIRIAEAFDVNTSIIQRNLSETDTATLARNFAFQSRDRITDVVQSIVIMSEYIKNSIKDGVNDDIGTRDWFRIDTYTFIDEDSEAEANIGRKPRVYVYAVFPYEMDQAIHAASNNDPPGVEQLFSEAIKEYNYIYTGKNEDVLDFNIDFNYAFLQAAFTDYANYAGNNSAATSATAKGEEEEATPPEVGFGEGQVDPGLAAAAGITSESPKATGPTGSSDNNRSGGKSETDAATELAKSFHNRLINSNVDMLMAEMTIWGDPYFLPNANGNYVSRGSGRRMLDVEGRMRYLQNEVFVVVNFLTPIDYRQGGALMDFAEKEERFSGLYRVLTVRNIFNNGEFRQELKLVRRHGQSNETSTVSRTPSFRDKYNPYSSSSRDRSGRRAQPVGGVPTILPEFRGSAAGQLGGQLGGILGEFSGALNQLQGAVGSIGQLANLPNQLVGQLGGTLGQVQGAVGQIRGIAGQVQQIVQTPQQVLESFSSLMPSQVLDFQSQFGQAKDQLAPARNQIAAAARSSAATAQRAGGAFASQTPSAIVPTSSQRPQSRPINTQPQVPVRARPVRPGQTASGQAAVDLRRSQRIDSQQGSFGA